MRPKIVIAILLVGTALLVVIILASKAFRPQPIASLAANGTVPALPTNSAPAVKVPAITPAPVFFAAPVTVTNDPAEHEKYMRQRIKELNGLAMNGDVESRDAILSEVKTNSDRRIRAAALEAAIQFDDRSVVPALQDIAAQTADPEEKASILEAIDYINLPSLTEYMAANPSSSTTPGVGRAPHRIRRGQHEQPTPQVPQTPPDGQ
jgi:hypothetical protein